MYLQLTAYYLPPTIHYLQLAPYNSPLLITLPRVTYYSPPRDWESVAKPSEWGVRPMVASRTELFMSVFKGRRSGSEQVAPDPGHVRAGDPSALRQGILALLATK